MKASAFLIGLLCVALCHSVSAATGTLALEGGSIAIVLICVATLISVGLGLSVCLYRSDLCPCLQRTPGS